MNVNIQTVHFEADNKLVDYVNKKLMRLDTFHDRIVKVEVFLKLDNVVHTIKDKVAEIKVHVPRQDYFVKCSSKSFEETFDKAMGSLINLIKEKKINKPLKTETPLRGFFMDTNPEGIINLTVFRIKNTSKFFHLTNSLTFAFPKKQAGNSVSFSSL